jgi:hypothetical protein
MTPQLGDFINKLLKTQEPVRKASMFSVKEISTYLDLPDASHPLPQFSWQQMPKKLKPPP